MYRVIDQTRTNYLTCQICWVRRWLFTLKRVKLQLNVLVAATETGHFDTNSSSEIAQKFRLLSVKLAIEQENILGEYSSFFKPSTWNHLHLEGINLYRNDR